MTLAANEITQDALLQNYFRRNDNFISRLCLEFSKTLFSFVTLIENLIRLFYSRFSECEVIYIDGNKESDLLLSEIISLIKNKDIQSIQFNQEFQINFFWDKDILEIEGFFQLNGPFEIIWLQTETNDGFQDSISIFKGISGIHFESFHGIICYLKKAIKSAELKDTDGKLISKWYFDSPPQTAMSIKKDNLPICIKDNNAKSDTNLWCQFFEPFDDFKPDTNWVSQFENLLKYPMENLLKIKNHLVELIPFSCKWEWIQKNERDFQWMSPPPKEIDLILSSQGEKICLFLDPEKYNIQELKLLLLHGVAHISLGHIRPGDYYAHWDTLETAVNHNNFRVWDKQAEELVDSWVQKQKVESLEECTALQKAMLGVWRMIGETLGDSRQLHPKAAKYQKAAYQRQAAQRLVATLEEFGGGMLCDGVGLGKTYVATTVIVHYANLWKDKFKNNPEILIESPFRITVLSPNSVVSTWEREAIPTLEHYGVRLIDIRVISHSKLSRISATSEVLEMNKGIMSDLEHLLISDLVIVDEAHNFRSINARRTKVLRDLLRLQPRNDLRRKVLLLTATPINNSLDDLRQEISLLFCKGISVSENVTPAIYYKNSVKTLQERCKLARSKKNKGDMSALIIHGDENGKFSETIDFRDDLQFAPQLIHLDKYLKEENERLRKLQETIKDSAHIKKKLPIEKQPRIAEELLDRIVVQRSRQLCKEIEKQQHSNVDLLFRPDASTPEKLYYSDEYDGIEDVLARFLPLFDSFRNEDDSSSNKSLSFKIYMWHDVREGIKEATDSSSVVGLQRVLVLKRLESSPVSFLITLLRLSVLHAFRLNELLQLCSNDFDKYNILNKQLTNLLRKQTPDNLKKIRILSTGNCPDNPEKDFLKSLSQSYIQSRPSVRSIALDNNDLPSSQMSILFEEDNDDENIRLKREQIERLWELQESLVSDFETLLKVIPELADIIFGSFSTSEWPKRFIDGGELVDWPKSPSWGLRMITDAKLRCLISYLINARRQSKKVIIFSQFNDTIAYIQSVLRASRYFTRHEWQMVLRGGLDVAHLKEEEITSLLKFTATVTGSDSDKKDELVNAFAPYYRIGPHKPDSSEFELINSWSFAWQNAIMHPLDIVFSTDVLAEGVNLQDAALLVNFDVHWNPVRMIQRAGRIDRRLNPKIENFKHFPDLEIIAQELNKKVPAYYWHNHPDEAPVTVNMILPDELETELQLREKITIKTLAIDFTLGLEQGTGAEADWMENYKYQGISSLNSFQKDRAIEQIAGYHEKFARYFKESGINTDWAEKMNVWLKSESIGFDAPLIGRSIFGKIGGQLERFSRYLEPLIHEGITHWYWTENKPGETLYDGWLVMDGKTWPPPLPRSDLPVHKNVSVPLKAHHLLGASMALQETQEIVELEKKDIVKPLQQGLSALAAPKFGDSEARRLIKIDKFFLLQLPSFEPEYWKKDFLEEDGENSRIGSKNVCKICEAPPGMHKCCPHCKLRADGEKQIEESFGFKLMKDSNGESYSIAKTWCKQCQELYQ